MPPDFVSPFARSQIPRCLSCRSRVAQFTERERLLINIRKSQKAKQHVYQGKYREQRTLRLTLSARCSQRHRRHDGPCIILGPRYPESRWSPQIYKLEGQKCVRPPRLLSLSNPSAAMSTAEASSSSLGDSSSTGSIATEAPFILRQSPGITNPLRHGQGSPRKLPHCRECRRPMKGHHKYADCPRVSGTHLV